MHALHIIVQENDDQQIKKNIRLKFPEFSLSFAKFSNSLSFPCREFLLAIFLVFPVFPVPWVPCIFRHMFIIQFILSFGDELCLEVSLTLASPYVYLSRRKRVGPK